MFGERCEGEWGRNGRKIERDKQGELPREGRDLWDTSWLAARPHNKRARPAVRVGADRSEPTDAPQTPRGFGSSQSVRTSVEAG